MAWASGDYTLLLSADDLLTPGALGRAVQVFDSRPEVALIYGGQILFSTDAPPLDKPIREEGARRIMDGQSFVASLCASGSNPVNTPTALVRTRMLAEVGGDTPICRTPPTWNYGCTAHCTAR